MDLNDKLKDLIQGFDPYLKSNTQSISNEYQNVSPSTSSANLIDSKDSSLKDSSFNLDEETVILENLRLQLKRKVDSVFDLDQLYLNLRKKFLVDKIDNLTDEEVFKVNQLVHPTNAQLMKLYDIRLNESTKLSTNDALDEKMLIVDKWQATYDDSLSNRAKASSIKSDSKVNSRQESDDTTIIDSLESDDSTLISDDATEINSELHFSQTSDTTASKQSLSNSSSKLPSKKPKKSQKQQQKQQQKNKAPIIHLETEKINSYFDQINLNDIDDDGFIHYDKSVIKDGAFEFVNRGRKRMLCPNCPSVASYDRDFKKHSDCHKVQYNEKDEVQCDYCNWTINKKIKHLVGQSHLNSHSIHSLVNNYGLDLESLDEETKNKKWCIDYQKKAKEYKFLDSIANNQLESNYSFANQAEDLSNVSEDNDLPKLRNRPPFDYTVFNNEYY